MTIESILEPLTEGYHLDKDAEAFLAKHSIDPETLHWLGSGDMGEAYGVEDRDIVFKITSSRSEYELSLLQKEQNNKFLCKIYDAEKGKNSYFILMEELRTPSSIESKWSELSGYYDMQGLGMEEGLMHFDWDEFTEQTGEEPPEHIQKFEQDLYAVYRTYQELAQVPDLKDDNLGYDAEGTLKAFDLHDKAYR